MCLMPLATGQGDDGDLKHLIATPMNSNRSVSVSARSIERGAEYPAIIRLAGKVEINAPVCLRPNPQGALVCNGYLVVQADSAEFHEDTGEIDAHGAVKVIPQARKRGGQ
jgi:hypothetical protein